MLWFMFLLRKCPKSNKNKILKLFFGRLPMFSFRESLWNGFEKQTIRRTIIIPEGTPFWFWLNSSFVFIITWSDMWSCDLIENRTCVFLPLHKSRALRQHQRCAVFIAAIATVARTAQARQLLDVHQRKITSIIFLKSNPLFEMNDHPNFMYFNLNGENKDVSMCMRMLFPRTDVSTFESD